MIDGFFNFKLVMKGCTFIVSSFFKHRWIGRYEAHLWDKTCWNESKDKKGGAIIFQGVSKYCGVSRNVLINSKKGIK
ncbi:AP2-like ethylene-responsive transcription factor AIL7 isoform X2 [Cryptomeria japonica]|uniref:AP2-like ethylene-responsive transcription factor AIL7 isoform X2 n=1 Tax=Cryptomeria japonica TaxID=3369 RepID=UPI0027DA86C1|nr:AP2-like ethylene-responsive transcription factor AIL7 isoform X2 [Cryptomeria japonica]